MHLGLSLAFISTWVFQLAWACVYVRAVELYDCKLKRVGAVVYTSARHRYQVCGTGTCGCWLGARARGV